MLGPATELVYETAAPFLWAMVAGARRIAVRRHRQRRQGLPGRSAGQGLVVLRQRRARGARARAGAGRRPLRRHARPTAGSTRSIATATATTFFDPDDKYIWALAVDAQGQRLRRHRREGRRLQDRARRQGRDVLPDQGDARDGAGFDKAGNLLVGTGSPGPRAARRSDGKALRPARLAVPGDPRAALRRQGHAVRRGAQRPATAAAPRRPPSDSARPPPADTGRRSGRRRSSVEITSIAVVDTAAAAAHPTGVGRARTGGSPKGAVYRIAARRTLGSALGVARRLALRSRRSRQTAR